MSDSQQLLRMLEPAVRPIGSPSPGRAPSKPLDQQSFAEVLESIGSKPRGSCSEPLKFSHHAQQRLQQQGVTLTDTQRQALADAADRAEAKGARDTLMMMDTLGLVVNIPNRTVVTALTGDRMRDGVITQIDSAVMVDAKTSDIIGADDSTPLRNRIFL
jgi:flagellar operon protein